MTSFFHRLAGRDLNRDVLRRLYKFPAWGISKYLESRVECPLFLEVSLFIYRKCISDVAFTLSSWPLQKNK